MAVIEISLTPEYVRSWTLWEGIREMVQNAKDGETEHGAKMSVHMTDGGMLVIENEGARLPREAMLIGYSTKRDKKEMLGQFGEGLKLGAMALVRDGYKVRILNGDEVWKPEIRKSEKFNADVLAFDIKKTRGAGYDGVKVEIENVGVESWEKFKKMFIFLCEPKNTVDTPVGSMILDPDFAGMIFVKGVFVEREAKFHVGYNLLNVETDRDRKMISRFDLRWETSRVWDFAVKQNPELISRALDLLKHGAEEVESWARTSFVPTDTVEKIHEKFLEEYGNDAIPVSTISESKEIGFFGKKGVVVGQPLVDILAKKLGSLEEIKRDLNDERVEFFGWSDLSEEEQSNLERAIKMIAKVDDRISIDEIDVVNFADEYTLGMFKEDRCLIARKNLSCLVETLRVVAHEWSHQKGEDGELRFEQAWAMLLANVAVANMAVEATTTLH